MAAMLFYWFTEMMMNWFGLFVRWKMWIRFFEYLNFESKLLPIQERIKDNLNIFWSRFTQNNKQNVKAKHGANAIIAHIGGSTPVCSNYTINLKRSKKRLKDDNCIAFLHRLVLHSWGKLSQIDWSIYVCVHTFEMIKNQKKQTKSYNNKIGKWMSHQLICGYTTHIYVLLSRLISMVIIKNMPQVEIERIRLLRWWVQI